MNIELLEKGYLRWLDPRFVRRLANDSAILNIARFSGDAILEGIEYHSAEWYFLKAKQEVAKAGGVIVDRP